MKEEIVMWQVAERTSGAPLKPPGWYEPIDSTMEPAGPWEPFAATANTDGPWRVLWRRPLREIQPCWSGEDPLACIPDRRNEHA